MTMTAANGDRLYATYSGTVDPLAGVEGDVISGVTHFTITGGTGRFAGASGSGDMSFEGTLHFASPMTITWWLDGRIGY
jgi:hypothetical protein